MKDFFQLNMKPTTMPAETMEHPGKILEIETQAQPACNLYSGSDSFTTLAQVHI